VNPPPAWCRRGGAKLVLLLWAATLLIWVVLGADGVWRSRHQDRSAADLCARLHLAAPAFYPAGHPLRHPEAQTRGILAGHTPRLPLAESDPQWSVGGLDHWETQP
jgi:hypothetical protein